MSRDIYFEDKKEHIIGWWGSDLATFFSEELQLNSSNDYVRQVPIEEIVNIENKLYLLSKIEDDNTRSKAYEYVFKDDASFFCDAVKDDFLNLSIEIRTILKYLDYKEKELKVIYSF